MLCGHSALQSGHVAQTDLRVKGWDGWGSDECVRVGVVVVWGLVGIQASLSLLLPTSLQLKLENQWPGMWGMPGVLSERGGEGGQGQLSGSDSIIWEQTGNVQDCDV